MRKETIRQGKLRAKIFPRRLWSGTVRNESRVTPLLGRKRWRKKRSRKNDFIAFYDSSYYAQSSFEWQSVVGMITSTKNKRNSLKLCFFFIHAFAVKVLSNKHQISNLLIHDEFTHTDLYVLIVSNEFIGRINELSVLGNWNEISWPIEISAVCDFSRQSNGSFSWVTKQHTLQTLSEEL